MVQLIAKLKESDEFSETIIEAVEDELGKDVGQLLKQSLEGDIDGIPNPQRRMTTRQFHAPSRILSLLLH